MAKERHYKMVGEESARQKRERLKKAQEELEAAKAKRDLDRRRERYMRWGMVLGGVLGAVAGLALAFGGEDEWRWTEVIMSVWMGVMFVGGVFIIIWMMAWFVTHPSDTDNEYCRNSSSSGGMGPRMIRWYTRGYVRRSMRKMFR